MSTTETERSFNVPSSAAGMVVVLRYIPASRDKSTSSAAPPAAQQQKAGGAE